MLNKERINFLFLKKKLLCDKKINIKVSGNSMFPALKDGDLIDIQKKEKYIIGDIIVFLYEDTELLVHRLVAKSNGYYLFKGDNAFRIEKANANSIIGYVTHIYRNNNVLLPPKVEINFIKSSLEISFLYQALGFDESKLKDSKTYSAYKEQYLRE